MGDFYDAFISYGRADSQAFVVQFYERLTKLGYRIWCDFNDIPLAVDFQHQIDDGITKSHNFLFIISPHSVNSAYCGKEIELAIQQQKRIIPILQVEQIDRAIWQQRHPGGTNDQWEAYQAKGLHSSFPNMHPQIGKINWVYMREGQDDADRALEELEQIFHRHQDYVENHTRFLNDALMWEQNQKQTAFLLLGETRQMAETWLRQRFKDEQAPCVPTDLHCEFITESIKNAYNRMTQVFLAYAQADIEIMKDIRRSLQRQGLTIWSSQTDIPTGEAFKQAVNQGIEEADNIIYLLSPESLQSKYCQYEFKYALALKKRIIPILVRPLASAVVDAELASLQYIDLTDNIQNQDYQLDESELIKTLNRDAAYYAQHKALLVKALKWQRQQQNPSVLLRGYDLRHAEAWLKTANRRSPHPATDIHRKFIQVSLDQPPLPSIDVFISYSSADADIARRLNEALQSQGKSTWFDQESIAAGTADFKQEIYRGIEASDNIVFILSPRSVNSPYCKAEVDYAAQLNKRFVTVLHHPVKTADLHPQLAKVQWLDFSQQRGNFTTHFNHLIRTLDTDREHVQNHTKWLQRSLEWQQKNQSHDLLLRGTESAVATEWLQEAQQHPKTPAVTQGQIAFITASQDALVAEARREKRRVVVLRSLLATMSVLFVFAGAASVIAFQQNNRLKLDQAAEQNSRSLAIKPVEGLANALTLVRKNRAQLGGIRNSVQSTLRDAIGITTERTRWPGHTDAVWSAVYSPDGQIIASGGFDEVVRLWDAKGNPIGQLEGHTDAIWSVAFSPSGEAIASASSDGTVRLWDYQGNSLGQPLQGHEGHVKTVAFSPDGTQIVTGDESGAVRLWSRQGTPLRPPWQANGRSTVWSAAFSPEGNQIISGRADGLIHLWNTEGTLLNTLLGHTGTVIAVAFSPDGQLIASGGEDDIIRLWDRQGNLLHQLEGHEDNVTSLAFSPNSQWIASGGDDNTLRLWNRNGQPVGPPLIGHEYYVYSVAFSPDGQTILSGSEDTTLRFWNVPDILIRSPIRAHTEAINAIAVSADGQTIVTAGSDRTVRLWNADGDAIAPPFTGHTDIVSAVAITPDGQTILSGSYDATLKLWNRQGTEIATLTGHEAEVKAIAVHPTQSLIASASADQTIRLWDLQGNPIAQLEGHEGAVNTVVFSPDGQLIVSGSADQIIRRWDLQGNPIGEPFQAHTDDINAIAFSPDSETFISTSRDRTLRLWTVEGNPLGEPFLGHLSTVSAVAFSPDGQFVVSASRDQTLRIWNLDGIPIGNPLTGHESAVNAVNFSQAGLWIVSGDENGQLRRWEGGTLQDWVAWSCDRLRDHSILQSSAAADARRICQR
ncbi:MAG: TIR domain-containing protein [Leptolyngbya sp. SIO1D8]|nr:TIR domain-containing protein [Leptolyngbya sp. SIO1D8]